MSINFSDLTPFALGEGFDVFNSAYKNLRFNVRIARYITVDSRYQANLPGLAHDTYGDKNYWRVILYANGLKDPINDVVVGARLGLPDLDSVKAYLARDTENRQRVVI